MLNMDEKQRLRDARCRHFTGTMNRVCDSKMEYPTNVRVCYGQDGDVECGGYIPFTAEELADKRAQLERHMDLMRQGLSSCCEAPFDTSQVITTGPYKNHGPRFCSKCKTLLFLV